MKLNIKIETDKEVWNDILDGILDLADSCKAKSLEIEGLDECEPFYTDEETAKIVKDAMNNKVTGIPTIKINLK